MAPMQPEEQTLMYESDEEPTRASLSYEQYTMQQMDIWGCKYNFECTLSC